ncbi:MAG: cupin domain-containing protein [Rhizobiales bacterium]|nr:cupin domain-containing protein [Hyphomicrobiales bacterium]
MKHPLFKLRRATLLALVLTLSAIPGLMFSTAAASAQQLTIKPVAEKKVKQLPAGPLFWTIEIFPLLAQAQAGAGATGLAAEVSGKAWLFTLGPKGAPSAGANRVAEIGPVPLVTAPEYLLRINHAGGPPGVKTPVHTHPGSEAFYVLAGRLGQRTPHGVTYADASQSMNGHGPDTPMVVFSDGMTDLDQLVMFVVDATKPFSSPANMP